MKRKIDNNKPIGKLKAIEDFLPPPHKLAHAEETKKITLALHTECINFFKEVAAKNKTRYQRMIRNLLELYVEKYSPKYKYR